MSTTRLFLLALTLGALLALNACESEDGGGGGAYSSSKCDAGDIKACACTDGSTGTKLCDEDRSWKACVCSASGDTVTGDTVTGDTYQPPVCTPVCEGKDCGYDGCGGLCGSCDDGSYCNETESSCVEGTCEPSCGDRLCGPDGCGGLCGTCSEGTYCDVAFACETYTCSPNCADKQCGDDGCGGTCANCPEGETCNSAGACIESTCSPSCGDKQCGPDGCGGFCGTCDEGFYCTDSFQCEEGSCTPQCEMYELMCGDDGCGGSCGECKSNEICTSGVCQDQSECSCYDAECGLGSCGQVCGSCGTGMFCEMGMDSYPYCNTPSECGQMLNCAQACLETADAANCIQKLCPYEGSMFSDYTEFTYCIIEMCGMSPDASCVSGAMDSYCASSFYACLEGSTCTPECYEGEKECGSDGCGGSCGSCPSGKTCNSEGFCETGSCTPNCSGKVCGSDGCGSTCGSCPTGQNCNSSGQCETAGQACNGVGYEGCCNGEILQYCDGEVLQGGQCEEGSPCGWRPTEKYYDCGTDGGEDPSGEFPKDCSAYSAP